jgi:hypothetical protein
MNAPVAETAVGLSLPGISARKVRHTSGENAEQLLTPATAHGVRAIAPRIAAASFSSPSILMLPATAAGRTRPQASRT